VCVTIINPEYIDLVVQSSTNVLKKKSLFWVYHMLTKLTKKSKVNLTSVQHSVYLDSVDQDVRHFSGEKF
jgi:hypothetical protein